MEQNLEKQIQEREEVLLTLKNVLIDNLDVRRTPEQIDPDTPLFGSGLGFDSVDAVELTVCMQVQFGTQIPSDASGKAALRTLNTLVDFVIEHREATDVDA